MKLILCAMLLLTILCAGAGRNTATAQTPGVAIAPAFAVTDGRPNEIGAYYRKVITPATSGTVGIYSRSGIIPEFTEDAARYFISESDGLAGFSLAEMNDPNP